MSIVTPTSSTAEHLSLIAGVAVPIEETPLVPGHPYHQLRQRGLVSVGAFTALKCLSLAHTLFSAHGDARAAERVSAEIAARLPSMLVSGVPSDTISQIVDTSRRFLRRSPRSPLALPYIAWESGKLAPRCAWCDQHPQSVASRLAWWFTLTETSPEPVVSGWFSGELYEPPRGCCSVTGVFPVENRFLAALSATGSVARAAAASGLSRSAAYRLVKRDPLPAVNALARWFAAGAALV